MVTQKVQKAINDQVIAEGYSSQLYLAMASWSEISGFAGAAAFLYRHAEEERMHMLKLLHYLNDRGGQAVVPGIETPPGTYKSIFTVFEEVMKHEEMITSKINQVLEVCMKEKDYNTANFMQWYVNEQIEEESMVRNILDKMKLLGKEKAGYYLIDKELEALAAAEAAGGESNPA